MKDSCSETVTQKAARYDPFSRVNHMDLLEVRDDWSSYGVLNVTPDSLNPWGMVHGGCLATLADTVAGWGAGLFGGKGCVTVNSLMNYLKPAMGTNEKIHCVAKPQKLGKTLCVSNVELTDDSGKLVASGTFTFMLLGG